MKKILAIAAFAALLSSCVSYQELAEEASSATAQAEKEVMAAKKMEYLWRDTEATLEKAKKAQAKAAKAKESGDSAAAKELARKAAALANTARTEAVLAQQQAKAEANAGPRYLD